MTLTPVAVVGAGTMGRGIAQLLLEAGLPVRLHDVDPTILAAAVHQVEQRLSRRAERGQLPATAAVTGLRPVARLAGLSDARLAIECVPERLDLKRRVCADLDAILEPGAVLATNTSGLDVTALAAATGRPERVLGLHFFNPPPLMALVEVIPTARTARVVFDAVVDFVQRLGKTPIRVANRPGFVVNRVLFAMIVEAIRLVEEEVATAADVDRALCLGAGHRLGPLALADFIGLDVVLHILESLSQGLGPRFAPPQRLRDLVAAGRLGRKSGSGLSAA